MTQQTNISKVFATEFCAVTLWIVTTLFTFVLANTSVLHIVSPILKEYSPMQVFLTILFGIMAVWEMFGLSFGSPFNPAVTLALAIGGEVPKHRAVIMWPAQFMAHLFSVYVVRVVSANIFTDAAPSVFYPPQPHGDLSYWNAVAVEAGVTALLCLVALSLKHVFAEDAKITKFSVMTGLVIGALAGGGDWTGSCMNPAMHFALAFLEGRWASHSVYWIGPLIGAIVSGFGYNAMFSRVKSKKLEGEVANAKLVKESERVKTQ